MRRTTAITHGDGSTFTRIDIDGEPTTADRVARVISDFQCPAGPGRLCLSQFDCALADEIVDFLRRNGLLKEDALLKNSY